jgi:hypothetical protein
MAVFQNCLPLPLSWFPGALYSYTNPTFPTFASKVVDYAKPTVVGYAHFPDMQPDKTPDIFFDGSLKKTRCGFLLTTETPNWYLGTNDRDGAAGQAR